MSRWDEEKRHLQSMLTALHLEYEERARPIIERLAYMASLDPMPSIIVNAASLTPWVKDMMGISQPPNPAAAPELRDEKQGGGASTVTLVCYCGTHYEARVVDIKRGWAKTCSKTCAATKREHGRPNARHLDGSAVHFGKKYKRPRPPADHRQAERANEDYDHDDDPSWDAHKSWV